QKIVRARIPVSTYRLQFNHLFTLRQAATLVEYFSELGVTDLYASPILKARPGSLHGYHVVDHTKLNPELGTEEQFAEFGRRLRERRMGLLMDVVPNHMCIAGSENRWWLDVLENGPGSPYARFFDVDWRPPNPNLTDKVLLPILGDQYGRVLENQEIKISYRGGAFYANYYETSLPVGPRTWTRLLELADEDLRTRLDESSPEVLELESIVTALRNLPPRNETEPERVRERRREKEVVKRRLSNLVKESNDVRHAVHVATERINGERQRPQSFDQLEQLLSEQAYRLSFWRVAADEINYRRFFDINELAAVRVEERPVFAAVHEVVFRLMRQGFVTGLRIDHVDGLFNPEKYLTDLQRECASALGHARRGEEKKNGREGDAPESPARELPCYVVVEKILGHGEELRPEWPVHGTTGYEFMNVLNGLFVETRNAGAFRALYAEFTGARVNFRDLLYRCKKLILRAAMSSELHVLARRLDRISEQHRWSRDFTFNSLQDALGEIIACFPVYRSYIRRRHTNVTEEDRRHIASSVRAAKRRNPELDPSIYDFVASLLLLEDPKGLSSDERAERRDFVMRFQQLTSPVTAKGLEDTAFYRYFPLSSLNEVGGEPDVFGVEPERFHEFNQRRLAAWPHALSATSTHDTKRGEDTRARINALSEIPSEWARAVTRWRELNRDKKTRLDETEAPDANEEYLIYQTLVGAWPFEGLNAETRPAFVARVQEYMMKALKEAKVHTSWISQNEDYERAVREFVAGILDPPASARFLADFTEFQQTTSRAGLFGSLSQVLLKVASPGVPDFYQGTELWSLTLVDPDNRRPVDYDLRRALLASLRVGDESARATLLDELMRSPEDGRVKMYVTSRALDARKRRRELFESGEYAPLYARGGRAEHVVGFARRRGGDEVLCVAARFFTRLTGATPSSPPIGAEVWGDTFLPLETSSRYRDAFTGREFEASGEGETGVRLSEVFASLPLALLERVEE
ncbi:MAG TPA: malto-oligosyltrehalose synthase, partial [Pyrinomonadaceae bacterium]|nr:malto-oligosyltrehalose synthase [Pyrinomonadaceae bacterium]